MEALLRDFSFSLRLLRKNLSFSILAITVMALGQAWALAEETGAAF